MKKFYILMASAALIFAASCNTIDEVNTDTTVETELITVELNPATKTALGEDGATTWSEGDAVSVTVKGENIGSLTLVEGTTSTFSGELKAGRMGEATLNYPAGVTTVPTTQTATPGTFADEAALLEGVTTMESLRAGQGTEMKNKTALLEFSVEADGAVAFTLGDKTYTITGCVAGNTYYACVAPVENVDLSFTLAGTDGAKSKSGVTFVANKVYALGTLAVKSTTIYLKPGVWASDEAWFAVHAFNSNGAFADIKMVDSDNDGIYEANIPVTMESVNFCRMNPEFTEFGWNVTEGEAVVEQHVWNQTADLVLPASGDNNICYNITAYGDNGESVGSWITMEEATKVAVWGVCGTFTDSWAIDKNRHMTAGNDGWYTLEGVELYKDDEFKFVTEDDWANSLGGDGEGLLVAEEGQDYTLAIDGKNIKVNKNGVFTLSLNPANKQFKIECTKEHADLEVVITIDNKANWSPLTISLWNGDKQIADKVKVEGNKYSISGDYIGSSLTCQLFSGAKESVRMNITLTKTGATVTLEETIIKLMVKLDKKNAQQWWGNTMKIHVWNTGTSFDTSWPGHEMTSEGNYTWSIIIPSELVGKKMNYLIHNGNGWQSLDQYNFTILAEDMTITGSSIDIN